MKKVAIFDIDGTVFRSSLLIELVEELVNRNVFPDNTRYDYEKEYKTWRNRKGSYDDYIEALVKAFLKQIKGVSFNEFKAVSDDVIALQKNHVYRYTRDLIASLRDEGYYLLAISQSPKVILEGFCKNIGFDKVYGRLYEIDESQRFTGAIDNLEQIEDKANILKRAIEVENLTLEGSIGVGDSEGDISFLEKVDKPICFNPNKLLFDVAKEKGWRIVVERKNVIYEI